jgi:hypothetical protein
MRDFSDYFLFYLSFIFKPTRRKPGRYPDPARLVSDYGTEGAPLLVSGNRGRAILSVSDRNVSAALSLLIKVCNSIYSRLKRYSTFQQLESPESSLLSSPCQGRRSGSSIILQIMTAGPYILQLSWAGRHGQPSSLQPH